MNKPMKLPTTLFLTDFSERDVQGEFVFYVLLKTRKSITRQQFDDYWRDVHGPICARLPGQWQYWQFHLASDKGGIWPVHKDIEMRTSAEEQYEGIAELTFRSEQDRNAWFEAAAILMSDEHNIFSKTTGYVTNNYHSRTLVDRMPDGRPNGQVNAMRLHVMLRKVDGVSIEDFRAFLHQDFALQFTQNDWVTKLRLHLLEEHDNSEELPPAPGVSHFEALEDQYQASIEIAWPHRLAMEQFFASNEYEKASRELNRYVKKLVVFPELTTNTFVYDGAMTLAGKRGSYAAQLITSLGAVNQLGKDIERLVLRQELASSLPKDRSS